MAGAGDLAGKDVLEVGCGRGGGTAHVFETHGPRSMVGVDLASRSAELAEADHGQPDSPSPRATPEALAFPDASFDVVLNVESSHCYPDVPRFLDEVHRVLRPGGHLLFADIRYAASAAEDEIVQIGREAELREHIAGSRLEIVEEEDITANAHRALTLDSPRRRALIEEHVPKMLQPSVLGIAGVEGTQLHDDFAAGNIRYLRFVLQKPAN